MNKKEFENNVFSLIASDEISAEECAYLCSLNETETYDFIYCLIEKVALDDSAFLTVPDSFNSSYYEATYSSWWGVPTFSMNYDPNDLQGIVNNPADEFIKATKEKMLDFFSGKYWVDPSGSQPHFLTKCECGSSAVGSDRHADYCPLYNKL